MGIKDKYEAYSKVAQAIDAGEGVYEVARNHGISVSLAYRIAHEWGVMLPGRSLKATADPAHMAKLEADREARRERNIEIMQRFRAGEALEIIGASFGITRERVRQITVAMGERGRVKVKSEADQRDIAWLAETPLTVKEAAAALGRTVTNLHFLNAKFGYPVTFLKDRIIDRPEFAEMAAKVVDGMSYYEAAGHDHPTESALARYCAEMGIKSQAHSRWSDLSVRKEIIGRMYTADHSWPEIQLAVEQAEGRKTALNSLMTWGRRNLPDVVGKRRKPRVTRGVKQPTERRSNKIKPVTQIADMVMSPTLREAVKVNRGKVPASLIAKAYGVSRNSVIGLWYRMRKSGEIVE